jgi:hypothetical protein
MAIRHEYFRFGCFPEGGFGSVPWYGAGGQALPSEPDV